MKCDGTDFAHRVDKVGRSGRDETISSLCRPASGLAKECVHVYQVRLHTLFFEVAVALTTQACACDPERKGPVGKLVPAVFVDQL